MTNWPSLILALIMYHDPNNKENIKLMLIPNNIPTFPLNYTLWHLLESPHLGD